MIYVTDKFLLPTGKTAILVNTYSNPAKVKNLSQEQAVLEGSTDAVTWQVIQSLSPDAESQIDLTKYKFVRSISGAFYIIRNDEPFPEKSPVDTAQNTQIQQRIEQLESRVQALQQNPTTTNDVYTFDATQYALTPLNRMLRTPQGDIPLYNVQRMQFAFESEQVRIDGTVGSNIFTSVQIRWITGSNVLTSGWQLSARTPDGVRINVTNGGTALLITGIPTSSANNAVVVLDHPLAKTPLSIHFNIQAKS